jgi:hypothetical protein
VYVYEQLAVSAVGEDGRRWALRDTLTARGGRAGERLGLKVRAAVDPYWSLRTLLKSLFSFKRPLFETLLKWLMIFLLLLQVAVAGDLMAANAIGGDPAGPWSGAVVLFLRDAAGLWVSALVGSTRTHTVVEREWSGAVVLFLRDAAGLWVSALVGSTRTHTVVEREWSGAVVLFLRDDAGRWVSALQRCTSGESKR